MEALFDITLTPGCKYMKVKERAEELVAEASVSGITVKIPYLKSVVYHESTESPYIEFLSKAIQTVTGKNWL